MNVIWLYRVVWCYGIQLKIYGGPDVPEQTSNVEGYEERVGTMGKLLRLDLGLSRLSRLDLLEVQERKEQEVVRRSVELLTVPA